MNHENLLYTLEPNKAIADAIATSFGIPTYLEIIKIVDKEGFVPSTDFKKKFNGYYRIRQRSTAWYESYYNLMQKQKDNKKSFTEVLGVLKEYGNIEVSFASKLISAVDTDKPIWDQYIIKNLGLEKRWRLLNGCQKDERIQEAGCIYQQIEDWYNEYLHSKDGQKAIRRFDELLPDYKHSLSNVKKLDYILTFNRK